MAELILDGRDDVGRHLGLRRSRGSPRAARSSASTPTVRSGADARRRPDGQSGPAPRPPPGGWGWIASGRPSSRSTPSQTQPAANSRIPSRTVWSSDPAAAGPTSPAEDREREDPAGADRDEHARPARARLVAEALDAEDHAAQQEQQERGPEEDRRAEQGADQEQARGDADREVADEIDEPELRPRPKLQSGDAQRDQHDRRGQRQRVRLAQAAAGRPAGRPDRDRVVEQRQRPERSADASRRGRAAGRVPRAAGRTRAWARRPA